MDQVASDRANLPQDGARHDTRDIRLPNHKAEVSHVYVFLDSIFRPVNQILSLETCLGSFHSLDVFQKLVVPP